MLTEGIHADITFEAQDGTVKAHRCLLSTISPVFAAMFSNDMVEQISSVIKLPDISSEALRTFLNFVYSG
jgi:speckle-type POZ protein